MPGADAYARVATVYDLLLNPFLDPLRRAVVRRVTAQGAATALDLCCGTGRQLIMLRRAGVAATGVDASPAMLARARRASPPDIAYLLEDATATSLPGGAFDAVIVSFALHEKAAGVRDAMLAEVRRALAPGGVGYVLDYLWPETPHARRMHRLVAVVERLAGREHAAQYRAFMGRGGLAALLERNGLTCAGREMFLGGAVGLCAVRVA
ncbi:MAG: class I SAM-dependent methyltransferase [Desulfovibrionaceae bacterium]